MITGHTVSLMQYLVIFKIAKLKAKFMLNNTAFEQVLNMLTASVLTSPVLLDKSCTWELDWPNSSSSSIMLFKDSISSAVYLQWMLPCRVLWKIQTFCCGNFISHFYFFFFFLSCFLQFHMCPFIFALCWSSLRVPTLCLILEHLIRGVLFQGGNQRVHLIMGCFL